MMNRITVGVFDDHPIVLDGIKQAIGLHGDPFDLLFSVSSRADLMKNIKTGLPKVLILDIISSEIKGLELFEYFKENHPEVMVLAHSSLASPALMQNLLFLGMKGFVNKRQSSDDLLHAISLVAEGHIYVPEDYRYLTSKYYKVNTSLLTDREIEIVNLIADEKNSAQIADLLCLSVNTVENHRKRIFLKLNVKNVVGMILEASRLAYLREK
jgi:DNA-binding NarL/FixJ family response regulator